MTIEQHEKAKEVLNEIGQINEYLTVLERKDKITNLSVEGRIVDLRGAKHKTLSEKVHTLAVSFFQKRKAELIKEFENL